MAELNIVDLIEKNDSNDELINKCNNKLFEKITQQFTNNEHKIFVASFYCYLNYNSTTDFVIDLDKIWKWIGYYSKDNARKFLERVFKKNIDYIIVEPEINSTKEGRGGHNIIKYMLSIRTFKSFCVKADTQKAHEILDCYLKLEDIIHETLQEENIKFKKILEDTENNMKIMKEESEREKELLKERVLLQQFQKNIPCVYYGVIDDKSDTNEKLIKFGNSNDLNSRVATHKKTYTNFRLINAFKVSNSLQIENAIKSHEILKNKRRKITVNDNNYTELLSIENMTYEDIDKIIKNIITDYEYNAENYVKVIIKNQELEQDIIKYVDENKKLLDKINIYEMKENYYNKVFIKNEELNIENMRLSNENRKLEERICELESNNRYFTPMVMRNDELEIENIMLKEKLDSFDKNINMKNECYVENNKLNEKIKELNDKITKLESNTYVPTPEEKKLKLKSAQIGINTASNIGYLLYAFESKPNTFKCGLLRPSELQNTLQILKTVDPSGEMRYTQNVSYVLSEKNATFLLTERLVKLAKDVYDGTIDDIILIYKIVAKIEEQLIDKNNSLDDILNIFSGKIERNEPVHNPETVIVHKAKRPIDMINPDTKQVVNTFESIEAAGRFLGLTTGTAVGIALRNKTKCKGYIFRYAGISHEDQFKDQPVIKVCCSTGERCYFNNIADAAKDCNISAPGLRQRILTDVHHGGHHWIFNKDATHYA